MVPNAAHPLQRTEPLHDVGTRPTLRVRVSFPAVEGIEGYTLLSELGRGGMGTVHLAEREDGARVAVKLLHPHLLEESPHLPDALPARGGAGDAR